MGKKFDNILGTIGRTPVVRINKLAPPHVNLYVKIEAFNPMGSVKDRLALGIISDAECSGTLRPGPKIVEATSGSRWCAHRRAIRSSSRWRRTSAWSDAR